MHRSCAPGVGEEISLAVEYDGAIPETIQSDPTRLRQIIINLVGNAIKFTQKGSVRVVVKLIPRAAADQNPVLQIAVIDTGVGMTPKQMGNLFRPFSQADNSMTRKFGGTGLGLAISRRLAEMLGGGITFESKIEEGSTFTLTINPGPLENAQMVRQPAGSTLIDAQLQKEFLCEKCLSGVRILLAEDGLDNQRLIGHILRIAGADVTIVDNGKLAYEAASKAKAENHEFNIILMDMQMPRTRWLRCDEQAAGKRLSRPDRRADSACDGIRSK